MIRHATFGDIPGILRLLKLGHSRSTYRDEPLDERELKQLLLNSIQRHGARQEGGCYVAVTERDGAISGVILGVLQAAAPGLKVLEAVERYLIVDGSDRSIDANWLVEWFHVWAKSVPGVRMIRHSLADRTSGLPKSWVEELLKSAGLKRAGIVFEKGV